ncbi:hypothetical protein TanjilG_08897 [Lupinus angustifolius]|uniref:Uncharacterized protein n=1 Tax=Lupinus angustifolius TaxID=3871 RepID=A0A394DA66_LUPAN|nr:hypothetical protein TanjilG_08897 [Lupinus angustifolius]
MARESCSTSGEAYLSEGLGVVDCIVRDSLAQPSNASEDDLQEAKDVHEKVSDSSTSMAVSPSFAPTTKGKKQKGKNSQASCPSSPYRTTC